MSSGLSRFGLGNYTLKTETLSNMGVEFERCGHLPDGKGLTKRRIAVWEA